jgi:hypothetical protein
MAEHDEASRPVVFVSHARDDEGLQAMALLEAALDVGYAVSAGRPDVKSWAHGEADPLQHAEAAVVVLSPAALDSASVRTAVQGLEARLAADPGFRLVALPTMSVDPNVLPGSPLAALAGHDVPPGPSLEWRVQQVLWRLNGGEGHAAKGAPRDAADAAPDHGATVVPDERAEWISDAPAPEDLLERGSLVRQLATRLERAARRGAGRLVPHPRRWPVGLGQEHAAAVPRA